MKTIFTLWSLLFLCAIVHGQGKETAVTLRITKPESGATYRRGLNLNGTLSTPTGREYDVKVRCFQMTHWLLCTPKQAHPPKVGPDGRVTWNLWDDLFLPQSGDQVMEFEVYELRNGVAVDPDHPVARAEIPFRFVPATKEELAEDLAFRSQEICEKGLGMVTSLMDPRSPYGPLEISSQNGKKMADITLSYFTSQHNEFFERIDAYGIAAYHLDRACRPGDALRALRRAEEIYDLEKDVLLSGPGFQNWPIVWKDTYSSDPPFFFGEYSSFYARRNELDKAVRWKKKDARFYLRQASEHPLFKPVRREKCRKDAARCYQQIGRIHYLLKRDRGEWDAWMRKYEQTLPPSKKRP